MSNMPRKTTKKRATKPAVVEAPAVEHCINKYDTSEEHRVLSHLMYFAFLISGAMAAYYTFNTLISMDPANELTLYFPVKGLLWLGWAFLFKTFGHRIHCPHY